MELLDTWSAACIWRKNRQPARGLSKTDERKMTIHRSFKQKILERLGLDDEKLRERLANLTVPPEELALRNATHIRQGETHHGGDESSGR